METIGAASTIPTMTRPDESAADHHENKVAIVARIAIKLRAVWCVDLRGAKPPASTQAIATVTNQTTCIASLAFPSLHEIHVSQASTGPRPTRL